MKKIIDYFGGEKRFYIILTVLFIMWAGVMLLFYLKADEVTKHPCSICASKLNENVICRAGVNTMTERNFYPNFTIVDLTFPG